MISTSMASKQKTKWHNKHVPTRWGVAVLGFLILATIILIPALGEQQVSMSDASTTNTTKCISYNTSGKCELYQTTTTTVNTNSPCVGYNTSGKCVQYQGTTTTQKTSTNPPPVKPAQSSTTTNNTTSSKKTPNYGQTATCKNMGGNCESTNAHKNGSGGSYHAGVCPGPSSWQCWVPTGSGPRIGSKTGTPYLVCANGKLISVGGAPVTGNISQIEEGCTKVKNMIYVNGKTYTCSTVPAAYKSYTAGACK